MRRRCRSWLLGAGLAYLAGTVACDDTVVGPMSKPSSFAPVDRPVNIFVDRDAPAAGEDGTVAAPFHTITGALDRARKIRFGWAADGIPASSAVIRIHVAASSTPYLGSFDRAVFDPTSASYDPTKEKLPLLINIPALELRGETELTQTADGLQDGVVPGTATIIRADRPQGQKQYLLMATRTLPNDDSGFPDGLEMAGDDVTITGFWLQADIARVLPSALIAVDGVSGFVVRGNVLERGGNGVWARLATGRVESNLAMHNGVGIYVTGGSRASPARVRIQGNRVAGNPGAVAGITLVGAGDMGNRRIGLDMGPNQFGRVPVRAVFDRTAHPDSVPDALSAEVIGNEVSNVQLGLRVTGYLQDPYALIDGQEEVANVAVTFRDNVSKSNFDYGLIVDAGQIGIGDRRVVAFNVSLDGTVLSDNVRAPAIFSLWRFGGSITPDSQLPVPDPSPTFAVNSTITICGDVTQFQYDNRQNPNPTTNPPPLNNRLSVNGVELDGRWVDSLRAVPAASPKCQ